jgi:glycerophosphoryl diester phosphodiesterase
VIRTLLAGRRGPLLCGHRGAPATHPENTLPSIEAALDAGCDAVEIDVHVTADARLAVIHDATVDRTTNGHGEVAALTAGALRALDAGSRLGLADASVPLLDDVLELCRDRALVLVELKAAFERWPDASTLVADAVERCGTREAALLLAFDHRHLAAARENAPWLERAALCHSVPDGVAELLASIDAVALAPRWTAVDADLCLRVHALSRFVVTWTVDDPADAVRLAQAGVDVLVTNDPARIGPALRALSLPP